MDLVGAHCVPLLIPFPCYARGNNDAKLGTFHSQLCFIPAYVLKEYTR